MFSTFKKNKKSTTYGVMCDRDYCERRNFRAIYIFAHFAKVLDARKYNVSEQKYHYTDYAGLENVRQFMHRVAVFTANSEWQCWSHFNTGVYGSNTNHAGLKIPIVIVI